ncbi:MAG: cbb3-type cytochrome c oxidase subunit 3 [Betaproteobacteria bacterium]|jgi:cytochrome c oxidase cbb3-type subunit 4|nr:cbb3-type cytochrome c oxidase subunit 3 [Betaproteobacteria bacterium]MCC6249676.1 cbb3-type cytochrome c oxidase subunit 3 [Rubrivivax sp.]MCL4699688.1 CcoQ/FixQ family Cbb3-type cytochrome c oxidase assembly chaperone [Burkholderiaceae bacterium]
MDVNDMRVMVTMASFVLFVALAVHTWSRRRRPEHDAAARLPFEEEGAAGQAEAEQGTRSAP